MADETDFLDLYRRLRLEPGCSLDDFKQAYRRHVAMWHPDRRSGSRADDIVAARLQRLTRQYGAAMEFYRRHGRLPGAPMVPRAAEVVEETLEADVSQEAIAVGSVAAGQGFSEARPVDAPDADPVRPEPAVAVTRPPTPVRALPTRSWLIIVLICVGTTVWVMWPAQQESEAYIEQDATAPAHDEAKQAREALTLGMTEEQVLAIEGEPTHRGVDRWEYGPSWIRFEQGAVADWYSSPLRALRVDSAKPNP